MSDNLQKMALALSDVEAELKRRRETEIERDPSNEFLDAFDDIDDDVYDFDDDSLDD